MNIGSENGKGRNVTDIIILYGDANTKGYGGTWKARAN